MKRAIFLVVLVSACDPPAARRPSEIAVTSASGTVPSVAESTPGQKKMTGSVLFRLSTPDATVTLTCNCKAHEKAIPEFPLRVNFNDSTQAWVLHATKPGFQELVVPITFADGQSEREIDIALTSAGARTPTR